MANFLRSLENRSFGRHLCKSARSAIYQEVTSIRLPMMKSNRLEMTSFWWTAERSLTSPQVPGPTSQSPRLLLTFSHSPVGWLLLLTIPSNSSVLEQPCPVLTPLYIHFVPFRLTNGQIICNKNGTFRCLFKRNEHLFGCRAWLEGNLLRCVLPHAHWSAPLTRL